jgi:hypothetical protein
LVSVASLQIDKESEIVKKKKCSFIAFFLFQVPMLSFKDAKPQCGIRERKNPLLSTKSSSLSTLVASSSPPQLSPLKSTPLSLLKMPPLALKIIGGREATPGQWPWQAAILNKYKEVFCGGTLVAPGWVLTAAHCVKKHLYIRLGEHDLVINEVC